MAADDDLAGCRTRLDSAMERGGAWPVDSPWLRDAFAVLPRDRFAPDRLWRWDGRAYVPVDRAVDPAGWADELYSGVYSAAVTQLDGGRPSSSLSAPSVVADMLDSLRVEPGHRVWDLGTGQGWTAALAAWRAGPGLVVGTEVDERLVAFARTRLAAAGLDAEVTAGDGTDGGVPGGGQVDRLHATYAVETVPWSWVKAVRPGGRIVYPWGRLGHIALTVADDGQSATGWVQGLAQFMGDRHAPAQPDGGPAAYAQVRGDTEPETSRALNRDPVGLEDWHLRFALRVAVPDAVLLTARDADGTNVWIHDGHGHGPPSSHGATVSCRSSSRAGRAASATRCWPPGPSGRRWAAPTCTTTASPSPLTPSGPGRAPRTPARDGPSSACTRPRGDRATCQGSPRRSRPGRPPRRAGRAAPSGNGAALNDVLRRFGQDEGFAADVASARAEFAVLAVFADDAARAAVTAADPLST
ncbi:methyltransferase domain-containing protein [Streptomyces sp. CB02056]|uniref:methyltransferase domain-containing protein n=2 Tax=Streptomycetaceae TaxID=2062 RepID=UPI001F52AA9A|nr:methyltransferase domain-containing protein [Streptomyces sp. CB02056]